MVWRRKPGRSPGANIPVWLVISRTGEGRNPCYLQTIETIHSTKGAWRIVLVDARRWQIEMSIRSTKSDLACECPRLFAW